MFDYMGIVSIHATLIKRKVSAFFWRIDENISIHASSPAGGVMMGLMMIVVDRFFEKKNQCHVKNQ
jgi:hypothetical protein